MSSEAPEMRMSLLRDTYSWEHGVFGVLTVTIDGVEAYSCETVERPWANNARHVSCIPEGRYELKPRYYHRGGYETWEVCNVPDRSHILIHKGNTMLDVQGCIAVGQQRGSMFLREQGHMWAVLSSGDTLDELIGSVVGLTEGIPGLTKGLLDITQHPMITGPRPHELVVRDRLYCPEVDLLDVKPGSFLRVPPKD